MTSTPSLARAGAALAALVALAAAPACAGTAQAPASPARTAVHTAARTRVPVTKIVTFVVENHSLAQMRTSMPFVHHLATTYAYADHYTAITHPSLPNYLAIATGSTHGITDDEGPAAHRLRGRTVFDQALARHRTAAVYADAMTAPCQLGDAYPYAVRHNPWTYFVDGRADCRAHDVPLARLRADVAAGTVANAAMVVPDLVHDAHDARLATSDAWIKQQVQLIQSGQDWRSGRLAVVVTADEDDRRSGNRVLTVVASRYQPQRVVHTALTHYSLTRLYETVLGAPFLGHAGNAASMSKAFGITTP